jgi:hypothetical protein
MTVAVDAAEARKGAASSAFGWLDARERRKFAIELVTVVLGILIALGLDQIASAIRDAREVAEAREAIRGEVTTDLARIREHDKATACVSRRLDQLQAMLDSVEPDGRFRKPRWIGSPPRYGIETQRWSAAVESGRTSLLSTREQGSYGFLYTSLLYYYDLQNEEQLVWSRLGALAHVDRLSDDGRLSIQTAIGEARFYNASISQVTRILFGRAAGIGLKPKPRDDGEKSICWPTDLSPDQVTARLRARRS